MTDSRTVFLRNEPKWRLLPIVAALIVFALPSSRARAQNHPLAMPSWTSAPCNSTQPGFVKANCMNIVDTGSTPDAYTFYSESKLGTGIEGLTKAAAGEGEGVLGYAPNLSVGVRGVSGGETNTARGSVGVWGDSASSIGVLGTSNYNYGVKGVSFYSTGVYGSSSAGWPGAGVFGTNSATAGTSVAGVSSGTNSWGVYGEGTSVGVQGFASRDVSAAAGSVFGVSGIAGVKVGTTQYGRGAHAIDGRCIEGCAASAGIATGQPPGTPGPGLAGYFDGNVQIIGTNSANVHAYPFALNITQGGAAKPGGGMFDAATSDERTKKEVKPFTEGLAQILRVQPVNYKFNGLAGTEDGGTEYVGVIAQQLEKVSPSMVTRRKARLHPTDTTETEIKGVDPSPFVYMLINAVKEEHQLVAEQRQLIARQDERIAALERGRAPLMSAMLSGGGVSAGFALAVFPLGVAFALRRRKKT